VLVPVRFALVARVLMPVLRLCGSHVLVNVGVHVFVLVLVS
jgi:hypothetical protein